jgi:hypothetical protein
MGWAVAMGWDGDGDGMVMWVAWRRHEVWAREPHRAEDKGEDGCDSPEQQQQRPLPLYRGVEAREACRVPIGVCPEPLAHTVTSGAYEGEGEG